MLWAKSSTATLAMMERTRRAKMYASWTAMRRASDQCLGGAGGNGMGEAGGGREAGLSDDVDDNATKLHLNSWDHSDNF